MENVELDEYRLPIMPSGVGIQQKCMSGRLEGILPQLRLIEGVLGTSPYSCYLNGAYIMFKSPNDRARYVLSRLVALGYLDGPTFVPEFVSDDLTVIMGDNEHWINGGTMGSVSPVPGHYPIVLAGTVGVSDDINE